MPRRLVTILPPTAPSLGILLGPAFSGPIVGTATGDRRTYRFVNRIDVAMQAPVQMALRLGF